MDMDITTAARRIARHANATYRGTLTYYTVDGAVAHWHPAHLQDLGGPDADYAISLRGRDNAARRDRWTQRQVQDMLDQVAYAERGGFARNRGLIERLGEEWESAQSMEPAEWLEEFFAMQEQIDRSIDRMAQDIEARYAEC